VATDVAQRLLVSGIVLVGARKAGRAAPAGDGTEGIVRETEILVIQMDICM